MLAAGLPPTANERGVFSRAEALAVGWTAKSVRRQLAHGGWIQLHRGVYADAVTWRLATPAGQHRLSAIAQALGRRVVIAGGSAACVHGFAVLRVARSVCLLRSDEVAADHTAAQLGYVVTTAPRTVVDCARRDGIEAGIIVADSALRAQAVDRVSLTAMLQQGRQWPHIDVAVAAVAESDARAESPLESLSRVRLLQQGLPRPELQVPIEVGPMDSYRVDFYWSAYRVIGEADGLSKYDDPRVLQAEKVREMALYEAGYEVVRWTWRDMWLQPDLVAERVRSAFARANSRFAR